MTEIVDLQAVEIEINSACNRACSYCPNSVAERKTKGVMSTELYSTVIAQLAAINFKGRISYDFYNEPLLHPKISEFVALTKQQLPECKIHLYSNGTLLSDKKFRELLVAGVDRFVITRHEEDIDSSNYLFEKTFALLSQEERSRVQYKKFTDLTLVNRGGLLRHIAAEGLPLHPCFIPSHMLTVLNDGRVLSCFEDFNEDLVFGDLKSEKLIDIWQKDSYKRFRGDLKKGLRHLYEPCKNCSRRESLPPFDV